MHWTLFGEVEVVEVDRTSSRPSLGGVGRARIADPAAPVNPVEFCAVDKNEDSGDEEKSEENG